MALDFAQEELRARKLSITTLESHAVASSPVQYGDLSQTPRKRKKILVIDSDSEEDGKNPRTQKTLSTLFAIPKILFDRLLELFIKEFNINKSEEFLIKVCTYWSLKKGLKRGAPLIKRLHLEVYILLYVIHKPWTTQASFYKQEEDLKARKYEKLFLIRKDLERINTLTNLVQRREMEKLRQLRTKMQYLQEFLHPLTKHFRIILEKIKKFDKMYIFAEPVNTELVPDYLTFIKTPMDLSTMIKKLDNHEYRTLSSFEVYKFSV